MCELGLVMDTPVREPTEWHGLLNDISWSNASQQLSGIQRSNRLENLQHRFIQSPMHPSWARTGGRYLGQAIENMERETGLEPA